MFSLDHLHNQVIHFPIALLSTSSLFDIIGIYTKEDRFHFASWYLLLTGLLSSLAGVVSGFIADRSYGHMYEPFPLFDTHGSLQIFAIICFLALCIWRYRGGQPESQLPKGYLIISMLAVLTIFYGSHLGAGLAGRY